MNVLVTGAAGFIGSQTVSALLEAGATCRGVDCFTPYYSPWIKRARIVGLLNEPGFEFREVDLRSADLGPVTADVDAVIHLAAQPGVRSSWSEFPEYLAHNVLATKRLLEAASEAKVERFVYASSSSIYGNALQPQTREEQLPAPRSPYGATKLSGEHLCGIWADNFGVPTAILRYFTVYGPGQRPDMAMHRLIEAADNGSPFPRYGDGSQMRDFTYVDDVVQANVLALTAEIGSGLVANVSGGSSASLSDVIGLIERLTGRTVAIDELPQAAGDVDRTSGSTARVEEQLGWMPLTDLTAGLEAQIAWQRQHRSLLREVA